MIRISEIKLKVEQDEKILPKEIAKILKIKEQEIKNYKVLKRSVDARKKQQIYFTYAVNVEVEHEKQVLKRVNNNKVMKDTTKNYHYPKYGDKKLNKRPVVIGFGPSGMFAALLLAKMGFKPIVFERGSHVERRIEEVNDFWTNRTLNEHSNIQFGEGGAGTFSDGKLTTRVKDLRSAVILEEFVKASAPEEILYVSNPHIGTDVLVDVVKNIRKEIIDLGGEIHFNHCLEDLTINNNSIEKIRVNQKEYEVDDLVLAIGHSARDTFSMLYEKKLEMKQKAFAVGLRIEHPQILINKAQYGEKYFDFPKLQNAEYKLKYHAKNGKSVYTFCMCPGGTVVPSSSEFNTVVTNGMSEFARDKENANSALVCTVDETDFKGEHPLMGMYFQKELEKKAFVLGGSNYNAPVQLVKDFLKNEESTTLGSVKPSYVIGYKFSNLNELFPGHIGYALKEAIIEMNKRLEGFALDDAVLTGVETRTSSPLRIIRDTETLESVNVKGIYPCGEGCGYAGGIMSSAIDGMKIAEKIISKYYI